MSARAVRPGARLEVPVVAHRIGEDLRRRRRRRLGGMGPRRRRCRGLSATLQPRPRVGFNGLVLVPDCEARGKALVADANVVGANALPLKVDRVLDHPDHVVVQGGMGNVDRIEAR